MEKQIVHLFVFNTLADWETGFAVEAWYGLFKTGDASYYVTLQKLAAPSTS